MSPTSPQFYLVKNGFYYRPNAAGYTADISDAGLFDERTANNHVNATSLEKDERDRVRAVPYVPDPSTPTRAALVQAEKTLTEAYEFIEMAQESCRNGPELISIPTESEFNHVFVSIRATLAKVRSTLSSS